ncbi:uncharacterized protein N7518_007401, partial [Penicillium psychrosexuale]|uniref:uncharacterized protein n=1 Tax=Penicillium psychrosexuale TaxID=1002107 RepID=UPI002545A04A
SRSISSYHRLRCRGRTWSLLRCGQIRLSHNFSPSLKICRETIASSQGITWIICGGYNVREAFWPLHQNLRDNIREERSFTILIRRLCMSMAWATDLGTEADLIPLGIYAVSGSESNMDGTVHNLFPQYKFGPRIELAGSGKSIYYDGAVNSLGSLLS